MKLSSSVFNFFAAPRSAVTHWLTLSDTSLYRKSGSDVLAVSCTKHMRVGDAAAVESTGTIKYTTLTSAGVTSAEIAYTGGSLSIVSNWVKVIFYLYVDNLIADTQTLLIIDEAKGDRGQIPYPNGIWDIAIAYIGTNLTAPYVYYEPGKVYYVLNKIGSFTGINPADDYAANGSNATWIPFEEFKAAFFEIFMAKFGSIGKAIFFNEFMMSRYGRTSSGVLTTEYDKYGTPDFSPICKIDFEKGEIYGEKIIEKGINYNKWTEALFFDNTNTIRNMGVPYAGTDDLSNYIYNTRSGLVDVYITPVAAPQIVGGNSDVANSVTFILSQKYGGSISGDIITINAFAQTRFLISGILVSAVKLYLATHIMFTYRLDGSSVYYLVMNSSDFTIEQDGLTYIAVAKHR